MKSLKGQHMTTSKALVFDIKRFAVHDGDGIRTTIFFKGCPLRCIWCQNPEGISTLRKPIYFQNNCIHCRCCEKYAKEGQMIYQNDRPYFNKDYQGDFDNLVNICPSSAIRYDSQYYDVDMLMKEIESDRVFYRDSGGVTFSGGEPLMQGEFLIDILKRCHQQHIHTAIETTLYTSLELIQKALPYLGQIYIDLKIYDEALHQKYVGGSVAIIKKHIEYILKSEHWKKVIIRTPLIPHITATPQNLQSISQFLSHINPEVYYELLNYNPLASSKYEYVDFDYGIDLKYKKYTDDEMEAFYQIAYQNGIKNLIKE